MATPPALRARARARHAAPLRYPTAVGFVGLATATAVGFLPGLAAAAPTPTPADLAGQIEQLDRQAQLAVEDHAEAQLALAEAERRASSMGARLEQEQQRLTQAQLGISSLVSTTYRRGGNDQLVRLVTDGDPGSFPYRAAVLDRLVRSQSDLVAEARTARHRLESTAADVATELERQRAAVRAVEAHQARIEATLAEQRRLLARLEADQRARVQAEREASDRASRERAATTATATTATAGAAVAPALDDAPASGRAAVAVREARARLGTPYQWGASGPERFDCSGLTSWVWRKAGVSLPHSSRAQYAGGRKVSRGEIRPGDLVFHGSPIHHVGIYIGDGNMISAPRTGDVVKIQYAFRSDFAGAVRPG